MDIGMVRANLVGKVQQARATWWYAHDMPDAAPNGPLHDFPECHDEACVRAMALFEKAWADWNKFHDFLKSSSRAP